MRRTSLHGLLTLTLPLLGHSPLLGVSDDERRAQRRNGCTAAQSQGQVARIRHLLGGCEEVRWTWRRTLCGGWKCRPAGYRCCRCRAWCPASYLAHGIHCSQCRSGGLQRDGARQCTGGCLLRALHCTAHNPAASMRPGSRLGGTEARDLRGLGQQCVVAARAAAGRRQQQGAGFCFARPRSLNRPASGQAGSSSGRRSSKAPAGRRSKKAAAAVAAGKQAGTGWSMGVGGRPQPPKHARSWECAALTCALACILCSLPTLWVTTGPRRASQRLGDWAKS